MNFKFFAVLFFFVATQLVLSKILMPPYLQAVSTSEVYVMVEADSKEPVKVTYYLPDSTELSKSTTFYIETNANPGNTYVHRIKIDNLKPATTYPYTVSQNTKPSQHFSFTTAKVTGSKFKFAVMGDNRSNPGVFSTILFNAKKKNPEFSLLTGDLCIDSKYQSWKKEFFVDNLFNLFSNSPFYNAVGNHEGWQANTRAFTQAPLSSSGKQEYYSFEYGDALFVILSTEHPMKKGSEQYKFVENELKHTNRKWKIVAYHQSAYVYGGHGNFTPAKNLADDLFKKYNVNLAISGHSHFYQHNLVDGVHHLTIGGGGAPLYSPKNDKKHTLKSAKQYHYSIIDVTPDKLSIKVYNIDDQIIDELDMSK